MDDIVNGIIEAFQLIITMDHEVMEIAQRSLTVSMEATIIAALIAIPLGAVIYYFSFRGKRIVIGTVQTLYALPTVLVGLLVYLLVSISDVVHDEHDGVCTDTFDHSDHCRSYDCRTFQS